MDPRSACLHAQQHVNDEKVGNLQPHPHNYLQKDKRCVRKLRTDTGDSTLRAFSRNALIMTPIVLEITSGILHTFEYVSVVAHVRICARVGSYRVSQMESPKSFVCLCVTK
jgi:hypothetical protein